MNKYTSMNVVYADGKADRFDIEPMGRNMAKELMLHLFYQESGDKDDEIVSIRIFPQGKGKPLGIVRNAL